MSFLPVETHVDYILTHPHSVRFTVNETKSFPHFMDNQVENLLTTRNYFGVEPDTAIFLSRGTLNTYMHYLRAMGYRAGSSGDIKGSQRRILRRRPGNVSLTSYNKT